MCLRSAACFCLATLQMDPDKYKTTLARPAKPVPSKEEEHFILQVPAAIADRLRTLLQEDRARGREEDGNAPARVNITFGEEEEGRPRACSLWLDGETLPGRMCNLPTVVETHKSLEAGAGVYYKVGPARSQRPR